MSDIEQAPRNRMAELQMAYLEIQRVPSWRDSQASLIWGKLDSGNRRHFKCQVPGMSKVDTCPPVPGKQILPCCT